MILYGFALYLPSLQSTSFYFDDKYSIENNQVIKKIDVSKIFQSFNTRFLVGLSFAVNYQLCALNPSGYRFINLLIHCFNAFLVYLLVKLTLSLYFQDKFIESYRLKWGAFFASMLFLCHPIQTEAVNFITQRFVLMATFFYLMTLLLYVQYRCRFQKWYLFASIGAAAASMLCKEFVITLPLMLAFYDFYFLGFLKETLWKRCRRLIPFFAIALIVPFLLLKTPPTAIGMASIADSHLIQKGNIQKVDIDITRALGGKSRKQYFFTELNVVCTYVRLLFLPINQNLDYDYPLSRGWDNKTVCCGVFLLCLLVLAGATYKSYRGISFSILWFFIALSVESSFIPIGDVITEYRPYLASVGFSFLMMSVIYGWPLGIKKLNMIAWGILICFSVLTFQRNKVWGNEIALWSDTIQKSPHKARGYLSRGFAYYEQGKFNQALSDFNKAIVIDPAYTMAYYDRGYIFEEQNKFSQAFMDYKKVIEINPNYEDVYFNLGNVEYKEGEFVQAIHDYSKAIAINPNFKDAYNNRAISYRALKGL